MAMRGNGLALSGIHHWFGATQALDAITLRVEPGELIALLGPSGCGKTTLLQIIAGFLQPSTGEVLLDGYRVEHIPANRRRIGMVFQNYALFPHLNVFENVAYGLKARKKPAPAVKAKVAEMLALVKMGHLADRLPGQLSGGQQQRVALARALAIEPGLVLLDEPFSALDKNLRLDMQIEIKSLLKGYGVTSIMVTHDQEEALSMADRIVVMNRGRIEQVGTPDALYDRPATLFVNQFIGHANFLNGTLTAPDRVMLQAGIAIALAEPASLPVGAPVLVSIRPENIALADPATPGALAGSVRLTLPLGAADVIEAALPGGETVKIHRTRSPASRPVAAGTSFGLVITDPTGIGLFALPASPPA
ncbi:MAG: ABC transporter ATP-binding protein [Ferrovibrio sp.]|uniref:ABC transporter ATP-binding protein n=1 Tax=Ferrovibrio sp. TaxID=1917215 RepID=UPI00261E9D32|nr:ABC transporter ATP-binding protein [Ferrovibrio sp.]MCW0236276.1 ABC transporter ATP-binding protein [Ferrovibrio sp.]